MVEREGMKELLLKGEITEIPESKVGGSEVGSYRKAPQYWQQFEKQKFEQLVKEKGKDWKEIAKLLDKTEL